MQSILGTLSAIADEKPLLEYIARELTLADMEAIIRQDPLPTERIPALVEQCASLFSEHPRLPSFAHGTQHADILECVRIYSLGFVGNEYRLRRLLAATLFLHLSPQQGDVEVATFVDAAVALGADVMWHALRFLAARATTAPPRSHECALVLGAVILLCAHANLLTSGLKTMIKEEIASLGAHRYEEPSWKEVWMQSVAGPTGLWEMIAQLHPLLGNW